ncbi:MAG: hypothetical protein KTR28_03115 [Micavibrio sp.]|nr:hypothetical protein [Micavibrio sp.]
MADGEKKSGGMLSKVFLGAVKLATIGVGAEIAWEMVLEPIFFDPIHNAVKYENMQAWTNMVDHYLGWIPLALGLTTTEGGLMNTATAQSILGPFKGASGKEVGKVQGQQPSTMDTFNMDNSALGAALMDL